MFQETLTAFNLLANSANSVDLPMFPADYKGSIDSEFHAKFSVVFSGATAAAYTDKKTFQGLVMISIFYPSGQGQSAPLAFIPAIDTVFQDKVLLDGKLTTSKSSIQFMGRDSDDNTLSRVDYSVPFVYYGEN